MMKNELKSTNATLIKKMKDQRIGEVNFTYDLAIT
jgi:hypothetical protein